MSALELLLVYAAGHRIAIPLARVLGVTERVPVTPLPFSPEAVDGLVLVFGQVVPQICLGTLLGDAPADPGGVLIVTAEGADVHAVRVDRVVAMAQAERQEPTDPHELLGNAMVVDGTIWRLLDHDAMLAALQFDLPPDGPELSLLADVSEPPPPPPQENRQPFTLVDIAGETYAFAANDIVELMVLDDVRPMPGAPSWIAGLIDRRGVPLLALSAAALLGQTATSEAIALVVTHARHGPVALCAARALGIERIAATAIHAMEPHLAGVASYAVGEAGRIIAIVSPTELLAAFGAELAQLVPRSVAPADQAIAGPLFRPVERLLTLRVGAEYFAVHVERVERIHAAATLTPLPFGADFDGMLDVGDAMVPVLDLRRRVAGGCSEGVGPCVLVTFEGALAGIAVDQVLRLEELDQASAEHVAVSALPIAAVANLGGRLVSIIAVDRLLPPA